MARNIVAVIDLQYGSTGKGQIAGTLAYHWKPDTVVTAWGPNAGHTFCRGEFQMVSRMLATSAVAPSVQNILVGPGSVIDLEQLAAEIGDRGRRHLEGKHLAIHPQAVIWTPEDATNERTLLRIGSTMKGTAEGAIRKIRREGDATAGGRYERVYGTLGTAIFEAGMSVSISSHLYDRLIDNSNKLIAEGAQGFSLGLHTDFYPHTTGRDVSTAQLFADCRLPWPGRGVWPKVEVVGVARTFPIRVANRYREEKGKEVLVGSSGGHYPDQEELDWKTLGRDAELTTVTRLPRRIFTFSKRQIREAVRICEPSSLALTFCDYLNNPDLAVDLADDIQREAAHGVPVRFMSFGPDIMDVKRRMFPGKELQPLINTANDYFGGFD